jgi:hypothetical protein
MHSTTYLLIIRFISNNNKNTQYFCLHFTDITLHLRKLPCQNANQKDLSLEKARPNHRLQENM